MDAWLINPYGQLPGEGWRDYRFTLAARALAARGHRVTWFTARFDHHAKRVRAEAPRDTFAIELVDTPPYSRNISVARLRFERAFARNVERLGRARTKPDVIIAADPPQFCGAAGRRLAQHHGVPLVLDCLDLWPELFVSSAPAVLRPFVLLAVQPLRAMRRRNVRAAALTIAVADAYRRVLEAAGARRAITIPIGVELVRVDPIPHERFTLIYAGSLGERYDLDTLFDAVAQLDVDLIVAGQGPAEAQLRARALPNVRFMGVVDPSDLPKLYARADAGVATYAKGSTVAMPLKFFDYLAAGLPIITSLEGEVPATRYEAGDVESLREAISSLRGAGWKPALHEDEIDAVDAKSLYARYADDIEALVR